MPRERKAVGKLEAGEPLEYGDLLALELLCVTCRGDGCPHAPAKEGEGAPPAKPCPGWCAPADMRRAAKTIREDREYILNAWETGRTNAVAEGLNRVIKDVIRDCRGFNSFEALRRRCLIRLGSPREAGGPIPLFTRGGRKEAEED